MNYKPKIKNLSLLGEYPSLVELSLRQAIINSLEGLNKLKSLNWLQVAHVRNIETLEGLESSSLKCLEIDTCKKITDFEKIARLHNLEKLILSNCGKIPTLKFISKMKNLKFLSFVNSEIIDGELSYCLELDYVGFNNKRHYTHTFEQFEKKNKTKINFFD